MNADVTLADLAPCGTVHIRAEYRLRIDDKLLSGSEHPELSSDPHTFSSAGGSSTV
jgi:hypothetical protein